MAHGSCGKSSSEAFDHWIHSDEVVTIDEEERSRGMKHGRIDDRVFHDCVLTIIDKTDTSEAEIFVKVRTMYLDGEYDEPISLKGIREMFPEAKTITVFAENALKGKIYRYGNHGDFWEYVGDTLGYA